MPKTVQEIAATMKMLRNHHVVTERDRDFEALLVDLLEVDEHGQLTHEPIRVTAGTETHGIALIEGSGGGKTTAILKVLQGCEPLQNNPETGAPRYLHVKVESPATLRSLGSQVLRKLGVDTVSDRAKVYDIWAMVRHRLAVMGISVLWLDEAHDMFKSATSLETDNMFKMLKSLMQGDHPVILVLSGTERLDWITSFDAQVNRRFSKLRPQELQFGVDNMPLKELIEFYARKAGLEAAIDEDTVVRLIHGGRHRFGRCVRTLVAAIKCALQDGSNELRQEHFEIAWGREEGCEIVQNVFAAADWQSIELKDENDELYERQRAAQDPKSKKKAGVV
ncbi:TniB family NTP-binding protein [uncultured Roseobacter sp.]|uniref:TniB family NTP-binding protein n=1 Tax=uncultured Roseobacter sp. TaxID=114847 RepID=UPI00260D73B7|nr:TniB family NTP-binding protein [uncultured Roseobacter sp.]